MRQIPKMLLMGAILMVPLAHAATTATETHPVHSRAKNPSAEVNSNAPGNSVTSPQIALGDKDTKKMRKHSAKETGSTSRQPSASQTVAPLPSSVTPPQRNSPEGATARCKDGSFSHSQHHRGACSRHGGVDAWLNNE